MNPDNRSLTIETVDGATGAVIVRLHGALTLSTLYEFKQAALKDITRPVIVELSEVRYMDSAGLGALISVYASCQRAERGFAMVGVTDRVRTLLQITRVEKLLPGFASVAEAEDFVKRG